MSVPLLCSATRTSNSFPGQVKSRPEDQVFKASASMHKATRPTDPLLLLLWAPRAGVGAKCQVLARALVLQHFVAMKKAGAGVRSDHGSRDRHPCLTIATVLLHERTPGPGASVLGVPVAERGHEMASSTQCAVSQARPFVYRQLQTQRQEMLMLLFPPQLPLAPRGQG